MSTATIPATVAPHACGICDGPLAWAGSEGPYDAWRCAACGWDHLSKDCCDEQAAMRDMLRGFADAIGVFPETGPMPPRRVLLADRTLPHQIQINQAQTSYRGKRTARLYVDCNCGRLHRVITTAEEALTRYRDHLAKEGATDE